MLIVAVVASKFAVLKLFCCACCNVARDSVSVALNDDGLKEDVEELEEREPTSAKLINLLSEELLTLGKFNVLDLLPLVSITWLPI